MIATAISTGPAAFAGADVLAESQEGVFFGTGAIGLAPGVERAEGESGSITLPDSGLPVSGNFQASWNRAIESLVEAAYGSARAGGDAETRALSVAPGLQRTVESGDLSGAATTERGPQECVAGKVKGQFAMRGELIHDATTVAHQPDQAKNSKLVDGRHKQVDSHEESGIVNTDCKIATEDQLAAVSHFIVQLPMPGVTHGNDSQCERSAQNPSAAATCARPETGTGESSALPPLSRTNAFIGADTGVSSSSADESATRMAANDEFVDAASKADPDHDPCKVIDSRCTRGSEENQATRTGNGALLADFPRAASPISQRMLSVPVIQPAQSSGHSPAPKDAFGQLFNTRTIRSATRAGASGGFASEKGLSSLAAQGGMSPVQLRDAAASNGSGEQSAASAARSAGSLVNDTNARVAGDPFAAIDADQSSGATTWIHAGPRHAEAGYLDPSLGWVGVRADLSASGIHAAVLPGSPEAAQALGGHISGLSAYMAEHHGHAASVTLASPQHRSDGTGTDPQPGFGDAGAERHSAGSDRDNRPSTGAVGPPRERSVTLAEPIGGAMTTVAQGSARAGTYVSVVV